MCPLFPRMSGRNHADLPTEDLSRDCALDRSSDIVFAIGLLKHLEALTEASSAWHRLPLLRGTPTRTLKASCSLDVDNIKCATPLCRPCSVQFAVEQDNRMARGHRLRSHVRLGLVPIRAVATAIRACTLGCGPNVARQDCSKEAKELDQGRTSLGLRSQTSSV